MSAHAWKLVENHFDLITQHSRKRMNAIALDHLNRLLSIKGNIHVSALYTRTQPLVVTWSEHYTVWLNTKAVFQGACRQLELKLEELAATRSEKWDATVATVYAQQLSKYQQIFPLGRTPLLTGAVDDRITELQALAARVRSLGDLDSLAREIESYTTELEVLRTVQQRLEVEVANTRAALEPHRRQLATMLYRNLGALIEIYAEDPDQLGAFYDLQLLQEPGTADEDDVPEPQPSEEVSTHMAPMVGGVEPPIAVTGRRVRPPGGNSVRD